MDSLPGSCPTRRIRNNGAHDGNGGKPMSVEWPCAACGGKGKTKLIGVESHDSFSVLYG
jgi:hypothetical protein